MELETVISDSPEATRFQASRFARFLGRPSVILLEGVLGAGKTEWVKGLVEGFGGQASGVSSPTFALSHAYAIPGGHVYHWDLYRLEAGTDWSQLELWEHLEEREACTVVEWPERCPEPWPSRAWRVRLDLLEQERRAIRFGREESA